MRFGSCTIKPKLRDMARALADIQEKERHAIFLEIVRRSQEQDEEIRPS
jgi:hypothetical protein